MTAGSYIIQDEIERALIAVLSTNGTFAAMGASVIGQDEWTASIERDEAYPPAIVVEAENFTNDGGAAGWPLYIGNCIIRAVTVRSDDSNMASCKQLAQAILETINSATFKSSMATELTDTAITYHGATVEQMTEPMDPDNWHDIAWTLSVRCAQ